MEQRNRKSDDEEEKQIDWLGWGRRKIPIFKPTHEQQGLQQQQKQHESLKVTC